MLVGVGASMPSLLSEHRRRNSAKIVPPCSLLSHRPARRCNAPPHAAARPHAVNRPHAALRPQCAARPRIVTRPRCATQSGRNFCPEFKSAIKFLGDLLQMMPQPVPQILLSVTMRRAISMSTQIFLAAWSLMCFTVI